MNDSSSRQPVHLVLLHSNDIHGAFATKTEDGIKKGGISLLSGFVQKVKREEEHVIYALAGDLFMGSIIDTEYRGLSTIRLANALAPDVFCVGNHEVDYGLSHLLFLEKCADFPIICANMAVRELNRTIFRPWIDIERGGILIRFIGLLTESITGKIQQEDLIDREVSVRDVYKELGRVMKMLKHEKPANITVLLTHIGITEDRVLAEKLDPSWGIDLIIGGHSHTLMDQPETVNGVPIAQAGSGSGNIGRFDIDYDTGTQRITSLSWQCIPVDETNSEEDELLEFYQERYRREVEEKYEKRLAVLPKAYLHEGFHRETEMLDFFADLYRASFGTDVFLLSSNGVRVRAFGPEVTRKDLLMALPYDNEIYRLTMNGTRLTEMITYMLRKESWEGVNIFILFSGTVSIDFDRERRFVREVRIFGKVPDPERLYTVGITSYLRKNMTALLDIGEAELPVEKIADQDKPGIEAFLRSKGQLALENAGRIVMV